MTARWALVLAASFGVAVSAQQAGTQPPAQQEQVYRPGPGIQNPQVLRTVQPKYTSEALRAQIQGVVELEGTVAPDGTLQDSIHSQPTPATPAPANIVAGDDFYADTYPLMQTGLLRPIVRNMVYPKYTSQALRAKIQGMVEVEAVIQTDGTVGRTRVAKPLDADLDNSALEAARQWTFEPGKLNGQPVPVVVKLTLEFRIH